jgi:tRNA pseudouridine-54 N-methylase
MIKLVNFLILLKDYPEITKQNIDLGDISPNLYSICSIIRECFCLSYSIRKENNLFLFFVTSKTLIKLEGNTLRFLGSDERSQAILIQKALKKARERHSIIWEKSTPGIFTKKKEDKGSIINELEDFINDKVIYIVNDEDDAELENLDEQAKLNTFSFIISSPDLSLDMIKFKNEFKNLKKQLKLVYLPNIKRIENKILYINFRIDQQKNK